MEIKQKQNCNSRCMGLQLCNMPCKNKRLKIDIKHRSRSEIYTLNVFIPQIGVNSGKKYCIFNHFSNKNLLACKPVSI